MISSWRVKSMRFLLTTVILSMFAHPINADPAVKAGSHCAVDNAQEWGNLRFGSAFAAINKTVEACEPGDHLSVFKMRTSELTYFIAYICDPSLAINVIPIDEHISSVNCVYAGEKLDRLLPCTHSSTPSC